MTATAGKATRSTHEERRAEIIAKARELLAELGPAALTMRLIADEVGIKLASLQYHIPNKAALIEALANDVVQHYDQHLEQIIQEEGVAPEAVLEEIIRWVRSPKKGEWRLIHRLEVQFWAMALTEPAVADAQYEFFRGYRMFLAELIQKFNPEVSKKEALQRGALMSAMIDGCSLVRNDALRQDPALDNLTDELVTTALELARRPSVD